MNTEQYNKVSHFACTFVWKYINWMRYRRHWFARREQHTENASFQFNTHDIFHKVKFYYKTNCNLCSTSDSIHFNAVETKRIHCQCISNVLLYIHSIGFLKKFNEICILQKKCLMFDVRCLKSMNNFIYSHYINSIVINSIT